MSNYITWEENEHATLSIQTEGQFAFLHLQFHNPSDFVNNIETIRKLRAGYRGAKKELERLGFEVYSFTPNLRFCKLIAPYEWVGRNDHGDDIIRWL